MDTLGKFPRKLKVSSRPAAQSYTLVPGYYAIHGGRPVAGAPKPAYRLNGDTVAVFEGLPDQESIRGASGNVSAVYALGPGGAPAVPTGLIFIRFAEEVKLDERTSEIEKTGFEVAEALAYAPNAAWLRRRSGDIADALNGLKELATIPGVESVEPQMLMEAARR